MWLEASLLDMYSHKMLPVQQMNLVERDLQARCKHANLACLLALAGEQGRRLGLSHQKRFEDTTVLQ